MFSVIISEKGGAERRETFDRGEINLGRVQGNEVVLPKGNVSKRHARLLYRDGRFIVTDLKSTNGTYVNGRKIAQATIVREGDKIYIGDFIVRIEAGGSAESASPGPVLQGDAEDSVSELQSHPPPPPDALVPPPLPSQAPIPAPPISVGTPAPPALVAAPLAEQMLRADAVGSVPPPLPAAPPAAPSAPPAQPSSSSQPAIAAKNLLSVAPLDPRTADSQDVISHFPLEHDPDESLHFSVPIAPKVPASMVPQAKPFARTFPVPGASISSAAGSKLAGQVDTGRSAEPERSGRTPLPPSSAATSSPAAPPPLAATLGSADGLRPAVHPPPLPPGPHPPIDVTTPSGGAGTRRSPETADVHRPISSEDTGSGPKLRPEGLEVPEHVTRAPPASPSRGETRPRSSSEEVARLAAKRTALAGFVARVREVAEGSGVSLSALGPDEAARSRLERALAGATSLLADRPPSEAQEIVAAARRELFDFGAASRLFETDEVTELQVVGHDDLALLRDRRRVQGPSASAAELGFSSEEAVATAIRRLCALTGEPVRDDELVVERKLQGGARLFALRPGAFGERSHVVSLRKPARASATLEDLVRAGTVSRGLASFLQQAVAHRARILVTSAVGGGGATLLGALAQAGAAEDRAVALQGDRALAVESPHLVSLSLGSSPAEMARAVRATVEIGPDRVIVPDLRGSLVPELVSALGGGIEGALALVHAPTLRHALRLLSAELARERPGQAAEIVREELLGTFDLALEVARLADGRLRVLRTAELEIDVTTGALAGRDLFTFAVERRAAGGAVEGTFLPSGVIPRLADDLAARGVSIDASAFRRHPRFDPDTQPAVRASDVVPPQRPPSP